MDKATKSFIALGMYPFDKESISFLCCTKVAARSNCLSVSSELTLMTLAVSIEVCRYVTTLIEDSGENEIHKSSEGTL